MLKRCLFGFSMILIFVAAASAQTDQTVWKGFYAGGNFGAALGRSTANTKTVYCGAGCYFVHSSVAELETNGRQKLSADAFTGGLEGGINAQSGSIVYGGEVDYESLRMSDNESTTAPLSALAGTSFTLDQSFKTTWLLTARPRIGHTMGSALIYATGGLAATKVDYQVQFTDTFAGANESGSVNKAKYGWVGGLGVAFKGPIEHLSMKGEYLYADFGRLTMTSSNLTAFTPPIAFPSNVFTHSMALHAHVIRAGVDYHW
jgi:outer membrane immunogenic protein